MKLTLKQKKFADSYVETGNAYQSAIKAGYSESYAKGNVIKLLENMSVKKYIDSKMKEIESKQIAKAEEVLKYLTSVMRGETESEIVVVEGTGEGCSQARHVIKNPDEKERLKAAELIGRRYSLFTENVNIDGNLGVTIIDDISGSDDDD